VHRERDVHSPYRQTEGKYGRQDEASKVDQIQRERDPGRAGQPGVKLGGTTSGKRRKEGWILEKPAIFRTVWSTFGSI